MSESFEGNTFQQAQQKIITELLEYADEEYVHEHAYHICSNSLAVVWSYQAHSSTYRHALSKTITRLSRTRSV